MVAPMPRILVPSAATKGEILEVKAIINHQMETGLRKNPEGNVIPRNIINKFVCRYNGADVFVVHLHEAVAANPYFEFFLRATESGQLDFIWEEDGGGVYSLTQQLVVS